jgi:hypothetical protein
MPVTLSKPQVVVHGDGDLLFRSEVALGRLDRRVTEQELDLLQIAAVLAAELGAGPAQIVRSEAFDPDLFGRLLDHAPDRPVAQTLPHDLATLQDRPEELPFLEAGGRGPGVDRLLDPDRHRHGADPATLAAQIRNHPPVLAHLDLHLYIGSPVRAGAGRSRPAGPG